MEVSGRKVLNKNNNLLCKPCEESELSTRADGLCGECGEHMCKSCFDTHKKWKLNRGHTLTNSDETVAEKEKFKTLVQGAEKYLSEAKEISSSIKRNKKQALGINKKFLKDVNMFKEELISHVNNLTNAILKQGEIIMVKDMKSMDVLEKENEDLIMEISRLTEVFESQIDQPQKLFVSSVLQNPKLNQLREHLDSIQGRNKIESYKFQRNNTLECSVKDGEQLGSVQRIKQRKETDVKEEIKPKERTPLPQGPVQKKAQGTYQHYDVGALALGRILGHKNLGAVGCLQSEMDQGHYAHPLLDRQLIYRNIAVDGEYLSYTDNGRGDVGLYVDKEYADKGSYFEVEILNMGQRGTIAIGLVPGDYAENHQPGCGEYSIGYHTDGLLYYKSCSGERFGPKCSVGDRMGCGISFIYCGGGYKVVFTRNGRKAGEKIIKTRLLLYPAVGMHSAGAKVKVMLDAKMPKGCE